VSYEEPNRLILASTSRYRHELLGRLRLPFEARAPGTDETAIAGEAPARMAERLAAAKARSIAAPRAIVIGSDQTASLDGELLRKPGDRDVALAQLEACQGKAVVFHTGVLVLDTASGRSWPHVDETRVRFARLGRPALER
jgi:septum formation protein